MKLIWALVKALIKTVVLWLVGIVVLMVAQQNLFPEPSDYQKDAFGTAVLVYMLVVVVYVIWRARSRAKQPPLQSSEADMEGDDDYKEFAAEVAEAESAPLPPPLSADDLDETDEIEANEEDQIEPDEEVARDFDSMIAHLEKEEKFILMVGLLALYGDGELSQKEIFQLKKTIKDLKFKPPSLTHRDPTDKDLCLDETLAWSLNLIREDFGQAAQLSDSDVTKLFTTLTKSIEEDIKKSFTETADQREYSGKLKSALNEIANADGELSDKEKKLIDAYVAASVFEIGVVGGLIALAILGGLGYGAYRLVMAIFD